MTDNDLESAMNLIRYMAQQVYINFTPALRLRFSREDLVQEGGLVLAKCASTHVHLTKFTTFLYAAVRRHYNGLIRQHLRECRDARVRMVALDTVRLYYVGTHLRADLRMDLEGVRLRVSSDACALVNLILEVADGTAGRDRAFGDLTISAVSIRLRLSDYKTKQAIGELKRTLQR